jgi:hypothetical protein
MNPKSPIFIVSRGRWESRLTSKHLERMNVPYKIIVEADEYDKYSAVINPSKILVLPYENPDKCSIPARNFAWDTASSMGEEHFYLVDDNIAGFVRLNHNERVPVNSGTIFKCAEDFVSRYTNIALAGFGYRFMCGGHRRKKPPFRLNTGVYSCMLIQTNIPFRFRGIYNEDSDLSIRVLKDGWCTLVFNAFLQNKIATMSMVGGNTSALYEGDGRLKMAESLQEQHPDIVTVAHRFNRWQHVVDYRPFKENRLIKKEGLVIPNRINNYGMVLRKRQ